MDRDFYLHALRYDSEAFAVAAEQDLRAPVAGCPGWDVAALVWHLYGVHDFWCHVVSDRIQDADQAKRDLVRPPDGGLVAAFRDGARRLEQALGAADLAEPVWTWSPQKDVAFVVRRMAQETAVHRWDAQAAQAVPTAIEPALAADGLDEFATFMAPWSTGLRRAVRLEATDQAAAVTLFADQGAPVAVLRGTASDLLLVTWRRLPVTAVEVQGDAEVAERVLVDVGLD